MQKCISKKIKIVESGGLFISLDYLTIGFGKPKTLIISGIHGTERTGNLVIAKLLQNLPEFKGVLTILPIANPLGYAMGQRQEPLSGLDLNRQFTGKNDGRPALKITTAIIKLAEKYDYVVDLHNYPTAGVVQISHSNCPKTKHLASLLKPDVIRASHAEKEWKLEGTLSGYLKSKEIPYVLVELPDHRNIKVKQVEQIVNGIKAHLKQENNTSQLRDSNRQIPHIRIKTIKSPVNGVFIADPKLRLMDKVKTDEVLGELIELPSSQKIEIRCPYNGIICEKEIQNEFPAVAGNTLFGIGEITTKMDKIEQYLKEKIMPDLEKSRGGFDGIHTTEIVDWIKRIINHNPELKLDREVLIIAAYAHDWGYVGLFKDGEVMTSDKIENAKKLHMELGAKKIATLLKDDMFSFLTDNQKKRIVHLVEVHDKKHEIKDVDELILAEADMLSGIDINTAKPILDPESNKMFMDSLLNTRLPRFTTEFSKNEAKRLIQERNDYYKSKK